VNAIAAPVARKNAPESSQNDCERNASRAEATGVTARRGVGAGGAWRNVTACSGTVTIASTSASTISASLQPYASIRTWASGRKMKLASAPASVMAVIARRRAPDSGNHFASTVKAGS
jgi:hypothetical protein